MATTKHFVRHEITNYAALPLSGDTNVLYELQDNGELYRWDDINDVYIPWWNNSTMSATTYWTSGSTGTYSIKAINDTTIDATGNYSIAEGQGTKASGDYSHAGGNTSTASGDTSFIHSTNSLVTGARSVVLGGQNITGSTNDTVYVPNLNINNSPSNDNVLTQVLVRATDGTIKYKDISSFTDMTVTGGTYDINTGVVTFTNNSGGTFQVTGFTSGMTDSYTTTAYTVGNVIRFDNNIQGPNFYNVDLAPLLTGNTVDVNLGPVLDNTITTPPVNPENEDRYIVPSGSTGDWSGQTNNIAEWDDENQVWGFYTGTTGDRTIVTTGVNAGKVYEFNGITWVEQTTPIVPTTPFYLGGTVVDAGGNKTSAIYRTGNVLIGGTTGSTTNNKLRVIGQSLLDLTTTRQGFSSTNDITRTNNWYKILRYRFGSNTYVSDTFKLFMADSGNSNGSGTQVEFNVTIKKQNTSIYCSVLIDQKSRTFTTIKDNFDVLYNDTTKELNFYYKPTQNYSTSSWAVVANRNNGNTGSFAWDNLYLSASTLSGETSDSASIRKEMVSYSVLIGLSGVTTTHYDNILMDNTKEIAWIDTSTTWPTSTGNRVRWTLNNDSAQIYAFQPASDDIDFVFKIADNATDSRDNYVFWIDDNVGEEFDRYPLEMNGVNVIVNPTRRYALSASTSGASTTNFYVLKSGATSTSSSILHANTSTSRVGVNTSSPSETLDINGKTKTTNFQMTSGATNGYVLTSDASGNGSWQLPLVGTNLGNILFVATNGDDSTAVKGDLHKPWGNIYAAKSASTSGDTIYVLPGTWTYDNRNSAGNPYNGQIETKVNLWKNGITYYFSPGSKIIFYNQTVTGQMMYLFNPLNTAGETCTVLGDLEWVGNSTGADSSNGHSGFLVLDSSNDSGFTFHAEFKNLTSYANEPIRVSRNVTITGTSQASITLIGDEIYRQYLGGQSGAAAVEFVNGSDSILYYKSHIRKRYNIGGAFWYFQFSGNLSRSFMNVYGDYFLSSSSGRCFWLRNLTGTINVDIKDIYHGTSHVVDTNGTGGWTLNMNGNVIDNVPNGSSANGVFWITSGGNTINYNGNISTNIGSGIGRYVAGGTSNNTYNINGDVTYLGTGTTTNVIFYPQNAGVVNYTGKITGNYAGGIAQTLNGTVNINNSYIKSTVSNSSARLFFNGTVTQGYFRLNNSYVELKNDINALSDGSYINSFINNSTIINSGSGNTLSNITNSGNTQILNSTLISSFSGATSILNTGTTQVVVSNVTVNTPYNISDIRGNITTLTDLTY